MGTASASFENSWISDPFFEIFFYQKIGVVVAGVMVEGKSTTVRIAL